VTYAIAFAVALFLSLAHVTVMPYIEVLGVTPDLLLIFAACFAVLRTQEESLVVVPLAGLLHDLMTSDPLGMSMLAFSPLVLLSAAASMRAMESRFLSAVFVATAGSVLYVLISMVVLGATGQTIDVVDSIVSLVLPLAIVTALFTPPVYMPMSWFRKTEEPRVFGSRRITSPL
jgi:rod shape-determining protein MreD